MPRKKLIRTNEYFYHIWSRSNNKEWFPIPIEEVWGIFTHNLKRIYYKFNIDLSCFVLMNNHFHLLIRTPDSNIDKVMHSFIHKMSIEIGEKAGRINKIFGGRYKWSLIYDSKSFLRVYRYIYQNPLRANICTSIESYPFQSMSCQLDRCLCDSRLEFDVFSFSNSREKVNWINDLVDSDELFDVRSGLKKTIFKPNSPSRTITT